jgi:hypothetical protein
MLIAQAINPLIEGTGSHKLIRVTISSTRARCLVLPGSHLPVVVASMSIMRSVVTLLRSLQKRTSRGGYERPLRKTVILNR